MRTTRARIACGLMLGGVVFAGGCGGGRIDDGSMIDGPPPASTLSERLTVAVIAVPAGVMAGDANWRVWGRSSLGVAPVFTVPYADCGTLVGYTTEGSDGAPTARVARLDATDALLTTYDLGPFVLRGLAAEPDGHFAALLWVQSVDPAQLHVLRFDAAGVPVTRVDLTDPLAAPTDFGIGESRLEYGDGRYGAYYHVHGISGFANGHEGDALKWIDAGTGAVSDGWSWGCSHSMSELLRYGPDSDRFLSACVPGTSGDFATGSIGGIYLDNRRKVLDIAAGCNGSVGGELGGAAPGPAGWKLVWNSHQAAATRGQRSYDASTMNQDIGFSSIASDLTPGDVVWLTTTADLDEQNASIARWQPDGDEREQYVVGWSSGGSAPTYQLAQVGPTGDVIAAPVVIDNVRWGHRDDPFRSHGNGDLVFAWFDNPGDTAFHLARFRSGRTASCAQL
jgi:hypothetical protein